MPRAILISFFVLISLASFAQSDSLVSKISALACPCFTDIETKKVSNEELIECIARPMMNSSEMIALEAFRKYGDSSEAGVSMYGSVVFEKVKLTLIDACYSYFMLIDSMRYEIFTGLNEDSLKKEYRWFNTKYKAPDSSVFYTDRGILRLQLRDTLGAYQDLDKAIRFDNNNISAHLFRGWTLEMRRQYGKALEDFEFVEQATTDSDYAVLVAIVKRKKRMSEGR